MVDWNARLLEAVRAGNARRVKEALARGATVRGAVDGHPASTTAGAAATLLHLAADRGDAEVLRALLETAGARRLLDRPDEQGRTPLMRAVEAGWVEAATVLLNAGADVNARDPLGNTAVRTAAAEGSLEMVKLLLAAGADPLIPGRMTLNAVDRARERRTTDGRMITVLLERWLAGGPASARPAPSARARPLRKRSRTRR